MSIRNGQIIMPVWCSFISGGDEYEWESVSTHPDSITFMFSTSKKPEKVKFYAEDNRDKRYEFNCD
jgi:hypothetical protein